MDRFILWLMPPQPAASVFPVERFALWEKIPPVRDTSCLHPGNTGLSGPGDRLAFTPVISVLPLPNLLSPGSLSAQPQGSDPSVRSSCHLQDWGWGLPDRGVGGDSSRSALRAPHLTPCLAPAPETPCVPQGRW